MAKWPHCKIENLWCRVAEYRKEWRITSYHVNYAIPSLKGGFLVTHAYGNSWMEVKHG
jgi:hypothetical protein